MHPTLAKEPQMVSMQMPVSNVMYNVLYVCLSNPLKLCSMDNGDDPTLVPEQQPTDHIELQKE